MLTESGIVEKSRQKFIYCILTYDPANVNQFTTALPGQASILQRSALSSYFLYLLTTSLLVINWTMA